MTVELRSRKPALSPAPVVTPAPAQSLSAPAPVVRPQAIVCEPPRPPDTALTGASATVAAATGGDLGWSVGDPTADMDPAKSMSRFMFEVQMLESAPGP